jgi:hypothetical protein
MRGSCLLRSPCHRGPARFVDATVASEVGRPHGHEGHVDVAWGYFRNRGEIMPISRPSRTDGHCRWVKQEMGE